MIGKVKNMKRIVLYKEDSYIIVQHISDTGVKYPPMTIRKKQLMTQFEADSIFLSLSTKKNARSNACESDFKTLYSFAVSSSLLNRIKKRSLLR